MELIDNTSKTLRDDLAVEIKRGSKLSIAAACFSIYAFQELKKELQGIDELRFIFTSPTFVSEKAKKEKREFYIPRLNRERSLYSEEDQSTLFPSPIRIRCNNYFALGEQHPEFLDKMLAAMSKNPYVKDYMEQICQRELANTGLSKEAFAVLEKWEAEAQGKGKNEHGNGANDLNDIVEYISKCIFDKFGNYKTEREKIHRFCEKHKDDEQYEYYVAQVLKAMVTQYKAIEKEKKQKKNRAMQRLHVTFSPLGEVLAGFFAAGNPNLLYQYLGGISDEFLCIAKNTYSDSAYKFSEAFYIRRQQQRYLSDDMMTATCRILFADESITGDTILEKMRNPLPESVKAWGKDAFGCCRLALLNIWRSDSVPATEITKLRLELFENRKRMPITNETVSTIEELYATDEENGWLALASTFKKRNFTRIAIGRTGLMCF